MSHLLRSGSNILSAGGKVFGIKDRSYPVTSAVISLSEVYGMKYDPVLANNRIYISRYNTGVLGVYNATTFALIQNLAGFSQPCEMDILADGSKIYLCNHAAGSVSIIDAVTLTVSTTVTGFSYPEGIAIDEPNGRYFVANNIGASSTIDIMRLSDNGRISTVKPTGISGARGLFVDTLYNRLFINSTPDLKVYDLNTLGFITNIAGAGTYGVALDPVAESNRLFVGNYNQDIAVLNRSSMAISQHITTMAGLNILVDRTPNSNRLFGANYAAARVEQLTYTSY